MSCQHLIYLHGYMSSELSRKGLLTADWVAKLYPEVEYHRPRLDDEPAKAMAGFEAWLQKLLGAGERVALIGSSLGGFYSHYLAENYALPAVLINPAVAPYELLKDFLGEQTNPYTGRTLTLTEQHMAELKGMEKPVSLPELVQVWLESADEVLDYRKAQNYFANCDCRVRQGGDHSYQHFEQDCPAMLEFLLGPAQA